ncbi:hypothetical protein UFOVP1439_25 [uncultured Caudovirales phage]|uniref:Uncharacterized protein n=1 Tax=uncultured Caudovirales phage TaxID=2100421 RepID=A0A6J5SF87_9CAUD|nr:hypothetical protein UFOVP1085_5 [uncultured Caudovirales phage]CAB4212580.1 hypothetical protein UFOVP1439_25 [uncultured Caudovirales phage]
MRQVTTTLYKYEELTEEAKAAAIDNYKNKCSDAIYEDIEWSIQNDDLWLEKLADYGLTYSGWDHMYHDDRGNAGFGGLDIEDTKKLANSLGLDKRSKTYKLIANQNIRFSFNTGRDLNNIQDVEYEEYDLTTEEFEALTDEVRTKLDQAAETVKSIIEDLEAELAKYCQAEEEYGFSDEAIIERFDMSEFEFEEDGTIA